MKCVNSIQELYECINEMEHSDNECVILIHTNHRIFVFVYKSSVDYDNIICLIVGRLG